MERIIRYSRSADIRNNMYIYMVVYVVDGASLVHQQPPPPPRTIDDDQNITATNPTDDDDRSTCAHALPINSQKT